MLIATVMDELFMKDPDLYKICYYFLVPCSPIETPDLLPKEYSLEATIYVLQLSAFCQ